MATHQVAAMHGFLKHSYTNAIYMRVYKISGVMAHINIILALLLIITYHK